MSKQKGQAQPQGLDIFKQIKVDDSGKIEVDTTTVIVEKTQDDASKDAPNIGWLFYRDYYLNDSQENIFATAPFEKGDARDIYMAQHFEIKNRVFTQLDFKNYQLVSNLSLPPQDETKPLTLTIQYPGFLAGTGYTHESGSLGEFKIGMSFDYTTGLPYLPGSSIKGLLRSVFPLRVKAMALKAKEEKEKKRWQKMAETHEKFIRSLLIGLEIENAQTLDIEALERHIFEGEFCDTMLKHDVFFDAYFTTSKGNFLERDTITPHLDKDRNPAPLKNPTPLLFLKVKSGVKVHFTFYVYDFKKDNVLIFSAKQKRQLFEEILRLLGIGAKTNVGYGQFK